MSRERFLRLLDAAEYLAAHIHEAPVWIVPCLEDGTPTRTSGSSIYPAVQNILLAARALGLGATLTTLHLVFENEAKAALGLPPGVHSYALLPIRYPMGCLGQFAVHSRRCRLRGSVRPAFSGSVAVQRALHHCPKDYLLDDRFDRDCTFPSVSQRRFGGLSLAKRSNFRGRAFVGLAPARLNPRRSRKS